MEKYLPIGTVVTLIGGEQPLMIYGRMQLEVGTTNIWDYLSCFYPEGNLDENHNIFFNHDVIEKVHHMGLQSAEDEEYQELMKEELHAYFVGDKE